MKKIAHSSKKFLNLEGYNSDASIFTQLAFYNEDDPDHDMWLKIRDCGHSINLSLGLRDGGDNDFKNSLFKVDVLLEELTKLRSAMLSGREEYEKRRLARQLERANQKEVLNESNSGNSNNPIKQCSGITPDTTASGLEDIQTAIYIASNV